MPSIRQSPSGPPIPGGIDSTSDGIENESLVPDAATLTGALNRLASSYSAIFQDNYASGINNSASVTVQTGFGDCNWTIVKTATTTISRPTNIGGGINIGCYNFLTLNAATNFATLVLGGQTISAGNGIRIERIDYALFRVISSSSANSFTRCGFGRVANSLTDFGTDGLYFEQRTTTGPNWQIISRRAGVSTPLPTSMPGTPGTYQNLEMFRNDNGTFRFRIDAIDVPGIIALADLPAVTIAPMLQLTGAGGSVASNNHDLFQMRYTRRPVSPPYA